MSKEHTAELVGTLKDLTDKEREDGWDSELALELARELVSDAEDAAVDYLDSEMRRLGLEPYPYADGNESKNRLLFRDSVNDWDEIETPTARFAGYIRDCLDGFPDRFEEDIAAFTAVKERLRKAHPEMSDKDLDNEAKGIHLQRRMLTGKLFDICR